MVDDHAADHEVLAAERAKLVEWETILVRGGLPASSASKAPLKSALFVHWQSEATKACGTRDPDLLKFTQATDGPDYKRRRAAKAMALHARRLGYEIGTGEGRLQIVWDFYVSSGPRLAHLLLCKVDVRRPGTVAWTPTFTLTAIKWNTCWYGCFLTVDRLASMREAVLAKEQRRLNLLTVETDQAVVDAANRAIVAAEVGKPCRCESCNRAARYGEQKRRTVDGECHCGYCRRSRRAAKMPASRNPVLVARILKMTETETEAGLKPGRLHPDAVAVGIEALAASMRNADGTMKDGAYTGLA